MPMKGMGRLDATGKTVGDFVEGLDPRTRGAVERLRKLLKAQAPKLVEQVKWGNICWLGKGNVCFAAVFRDHVQFGFFRGATLRDPQGLLQGKGKFVRHIRVVKRTDIDEDAFEALLRQAAR